MPTRHERIPNANSPQLLTRLLEMIGRGVRSSRGLQEALGVDVRTIQYYTQAGDWLGFLVSEDEPELTPLGLEYVFEGKKRSRVYAQAVWTTPFVTRLLAGRAELPPVDAIAKAIAQEDPELAPSTARRRASSVRSLIAPALGKSPRPEPPQQQLLLPFQPSELQDVLPQTLATAREYHPDVYRYVLCALLDHGELALGHLRAMLDRAGASAAPLGGYVEMAVARGDAKRIDERLVVTREGVARRALVETTTSLMLSDPGYRMYMKDCAAALGDREAEIRRDQVAKRYRPWDQRLFGHPLQPDRLASDLERVLLDRPLSTYPVAQASNVVVLPVQEPFLDAWEHKELAISLPPGLVSLQGGVDSINALLRRARQAGGASGLPQVTDRPVLFHGGLLHPGEPLPRSVPDTRSLRLRVLMHAPYPALVAALLLLHRYRPETISIQQHSGSWQVLHRKQRMGPVLELLDCFAHDRGWVASRRLGSRLRFGALAQVLAHVGIAQPIGRQLLLAERLFVQLRTEAEEMEVHAQLQPLAEALEAWLEWADPVDPV